jgi:hypothetical protein
MWDNKSSLYKVISWFQSLLFERANFRRRYAEGKEAAASEMADVLYHSMVGLYKLNSVDP